MRAVALAAPARLATLATLAALAALAAIESHAQEVEVRAVPSNARWANLAYGFENGGEDTVGADTDVVLVDLFDVDGAAIGAYRDANLTVLCYVSAGTREAWRADVQNNSAAWESLSLGSLAQFPDESWLDITRLADVQALMQPRWELAAAKGCHGLEADNVDCAFNEDECYGLIPSLAKLGTKKARNKAIAAQQKYNEWQVDAAHALGLAIGLKNALGLVPKLASLYDFAVNEQCLTYDECSALAPFAAQGKAVLHVEYALGEGSTAGERCAAAGLFAGLSSKVCDGSDESGLCSGPWVDCWVPQPSAAPTPAPTFRPRAPVDGVVPVASGVQWANLAWGFEDGGRDDVDGGDKQLAVVDLFDMSSDAMYALKEQGIVVVCYLSAGTLEPWRDDVAADRATWEALALGKLAQWNENWLDVSRLDELTALMQPRFDLAYAKGCDGVEPDNVDCHSNDDCALALAGGKGGKKARRAQARGFQLAYNRWQAEAAHAWNMSIALKNALDLAEELEPEYDLAMVEECQRYSECEGTAVFTQNDKAVLNVEYRLRDGQCEAAIALGISRKYCDGNDGICVSGEWIDCALVEVNATASPTASNATASPTASPTASNATLAPVVPPVVSPPTSLAPSTSPSASPSAAPSAAPTLGVVDLSGPLAWASAIGGAAEPSLEGLNVVVADVDDAAVADGAFGDRAVLCSFSAGVAEDERADAAAFEGLTLNVSDAEGRKWLDLSRWQDLREPMGARLERARANGCAGVVLADLDCADNAACATAVYLGGNESGTETGGPRPPSRALQGLQDNAAALQLEYAQWLSSAALEGGLAPGLAGAPVLAEAAPELFDFALVSGCAENCAAYEGLLDAGKPVLNIEFVADNATDACDNDDDDDDDDEASGVLTKTCPGDAATASCDEGSQWTNCFPLVGDVPGGVGNDDDDDDDLSGGAIAGIVIGCLVLFAILAVVCMRCVGAKKKDDEPEYSKQGQSEPDPEPAQQQQQQQQQQQPEPTPAKAEDPAAAVPEPAGVEPVAESTFIAQA